MATAAIESFPLLQNRMFSSVLNLYVANSATHFVTATVTLLCSERLCDFCLALRSRSSNGSPIASNPCGSASESLEIRRQAELASAIVDQLRADEFLVPLTGVPGRIGEVASRQREMMEPAMSGSAVLMLVNEPCAPRSLQFLLYRGVASAPFEQTDLEHLERLRGYITNAWTLFNERMSAQAALEGISIAMRNYSRGTLMIDSRLRIIWHNRAARACVQSWSGTGRSAAKLGRALGPVPGEILAVCKTLRERCVGSLSLGELRKAHAVCHPLDPALRATVKIYGVKPGWLTPPHFVVQFERSTSTGPVSGIGLIDSLTSSESEIARLVLTGMSNQEIADCLGKTVVAIKFHLHQMFKKAEVKTRSRLMLRLAEK